MPRKTIMNRIFTNMAAVVMATAAVVPQMLHADTGRDGYGDIHNDVFWNTADGQPLYSHGGGIFKFKNPQTGRDQYYWYGVRYKGSEEYRADPSVTVEHASFSGVTCYTSDNLTDWTYVGDVLTPEEIARNGRYGWLGRLGVAYLPEIQSYVMAIQCDNGVLFATSESPDGPFVWQWRKIMTDLIGTPNTGDQTVFTDDDTGKSYLVYSYGRGRHKIYVSEIGVRDGRVDLLDCTQIFKGESREGNCMFKYGGRYYMCASNIYGWDGSYAYYLVADDIRGPYEPVDDMQVMPGCENDYAHVSQTGFFYTLRTGGKETVLFCGDRWSCFAGNGLGYNQWVPLSFDENGKPWFNSLSSWALNEKTGEWRVNADNNYVLNGSFEADRRSIPNPVKPRQEFLHGWNTEILKGNCVAVGDSLSPKLNYMNTRDDRREVIGEKSMCMSDIVDFSRKVTQTVKSTPYVKLPSGCYTLTAKVKVDGNFSKLEMLAESAGKSKVQAIKPAGGKWMTVVMQGIDVRNGEVTVGFWADGSAGAQCLVDDVELKLEMAN